jgi:superfamily II RNA helicase
MSHEYTQMAGRAGRRGIDTIGNVVHCNNLFNTPSMFDYKTILSGKPQNLVSKYHISYSLILNLLKNGETRDFHRFSTKSMMSIELSNTLNATTTYIEELKQKIDKTKESLQYLRTPYEKCLAWLEMESTVHKTVNKKRKEMERNMKLIEEEYKTLKQDTTTVSGYLELKDLLEREEDTVNYMNSFIEIQTNRVCDILVEEGFLSVCEENNKCYGTTLLGKIASSIAEINSLIMSKLLMETQFFSEFSPIELIGLFSCFTDIKIPQDKRISIPLTDCRIVKNSVNRIDELFRHYDFLESSRDVRTGLKYDDVIIYDIIDETMDWANCETAEECKYFIQTKLAEKSISIGDFVKALLKIATISRELSTICEEIGQIELLSKLNKVEGYLLKYVTTSQSLYV